MKGNEHRNKNEDKMRFREGQRSKKKGKRRKKC